MMAVHNDDKKIAQMLIDGGVDLDIQSRVSLYIGLLFVFNLFMFNQANNNTMNRMVVLRL